MYHFGKIRLVNSDDIIKFLDTKTIDYNDYSITEFRILIDTDKWTNNDVIIFAFKVLSNLGYSVRTETINDKVHVLYKKHSFWRWFRYDEHDKGVRAFSSLEATVEMITQLTSK